MSIDWSKAPEGATHCTDKKSPNSNPVFWQVKRGVAEKAWATDDEYNVIHSRSYTYSETGCAGFFEDDAVPRPVAVWSGAGLPPVGTICEWHPNVHGWKEVTILGRDGDCTWYRLKGEEASQTCRHMTFFRPIRTAEQIAADERLAAINYMEIDAGMCATAFDGDPEARVWISNLIDKGWRKQSTP